MMGDDEDIARSLAYSMPICDFGSARAIQAVAAALSAARREGREQAAKHVDMWADTAILEARSALRCLAKEVRALPDEPKGET